MQQQIFSTQEITTGFHTSGFFFFTFFRRFVVALTVNNETNMLRVPCYYRQWFLELIQTPR